MTPSRARRPRTIYALYPRSFRDSIGSGEGDLAGATQKLDHAARLGADTVWLCPFYVSPMEDGGYDIADHTAVDPRFGTLEDFRAFRARADSLGLDVVVDAVLNHTSERHPWFRGAAGRDGIHDDWYVFRDPRPDGTPPTNWISFFGTPAWRWVAERRQYVLAQFLPCQPCLDLRNEAVFRELCRILAFWRDEGVAGFRFDAVGAFLYDTRLDDNPPASPAVQAASLMPAHHPYSWQDHVHDILPGDGAAFAERLRAWAGPETFLFGEINSGNRSIELACEFAEPGRLDAGYTPDLLARPITPEALADVLHRLDGGPLVWMLSGHDHARHVSRDGDGSARDARLYATLLAALPGHLCLFQGEELGLPQPDLPFEALRDPFDRLLHPLDLGRDGARVPIPWEAQAPGLGFTDAEPWLPFPEGWGSHAVDAQERDAASVLNHYRRVLGLRRARPALAEGDCVVETARDGLLCLRREGGGERVRLLVNFAREAADLPAGLVDPAERVLIDSARPGEDAGEAPGPTVRLAPRSAQIRGPSRPAPRPAPRPERAPFPDPEPRSDR